MMMMAEVSPETVAAFLLKSGGRVTSTDLVEHFKGALPREPERRAAARDMFKKCVDSVAFVHSENGVKHVYLRKKFRVAELRRDAAAQAAPGSGCGSDSQVRVPHNFTCGSASRSAADGESVCPPSAHSGPHRSSRDMGNAESFRHQRESRKGPLGRAPEITVTGAGPEQEVVVTRLGPALTGTAGGAATAAHLGPPHRQAEVLSPKRLSDAALVGSGSQHRLLTGQEGGHMHGGAPKAGRKHSTEVTTSRSPQVRCSTRDDCDSPSVGSSTQDEDRASAALDPVEHEWMLCASDGDWSSLHRLLAAEPFLILRRDFITGFTCLHWAAKHGRPEVIALIVNFARQHDVPVRIDMRSSSGYTPLHVAAMHGHTEVVKLLVGAYNADVDIRDHSGRKACQYLSDSVSMEMRDISGADECSVTDSSPPRESEGHPREKPLRRKSSLKPRLQDLRARMSQMVQSTSFREQQDGSKRPSRSRAKSHFLG